MVPKLDRRRFLGAATAFLASPALAAKPALLADAGLRGGLDAAEFDMRPGTMDDQSRAFSKLLEEADRRGRPVFLPAGEYVISNITLPKSAVLEGVPGRTRIVYGGNGFLFRGDDLALLEMRGITLDGMNRWIGEDARGLLELNGVRHVDIDRCAILGSGKSGIVMERCGGRIERTEIAGAFDVGLWSIEGAGVTISGNSVHDCGNGGILVHRWKAADDGTIVSANRIAGIRAQNGGTGQFGNGINLFRANGVLIADNDISDCAFSAIRANSASSVRIAGNRCTRSGETAIYAEFAFEGAIVQGNIVDGAANGISVVNFNEGGRLATISGNLVRNLSTTGPYPGDSPGFGAGITAEADVAITANVIEGAPLWGIGLGWGPYLRDISATANVIRDSRVGIAVSVVEGAGAAVIAENVISGSTDGAIVGYRWAKAATSDLAPGGRTGYDHLMVERNHVS